MRASQINPGRNSSIALDHIVRRCENFIYPKSGARARGFVNALETLMSRAGIERETTPMSYAAIHPNWEKPRDNMVDGYSLEMTARELDGLREAAPLIRPDTQIAITFLPGEDMEQRVAAAVLVRELGFEPIVHISARRFVSQDELEGYLRDITTKAGVKRIFLIAGDPPEPEGPFENT